MNIWLPYLDFNFVKTLSSSDKSRRLGYVAVRACVGTYALCFIQVTKTLGSCWSSLSLVCQLGCFDGQEQKILAALGYLWSHIPSHPGQIGPGSVSPGAWLSAVAGFLLRLVADFHWF